MLRSPACVCLLLALIPSCASPPRRPPVSTQDQALATGATARLQQHWNQQRCTSLVQSAGVRFATLRHQEDWLLDCEDARSKWGEWHSFAIRSWQNLGTGEFSAEGDVSFASTRGSIYSVWQILPSGEHRLLFLQLRGGGSSISAPPMAPQRLIDPPVNSGHARG